MSYLALYRKYRPQDFSAVYGQDTITRILKNQVITGRIGHAYLFSGIRGTGKTTMAKIFARAVNCEQPEDGSPCGVCASCRALASRASMDIVEIDAASNRGVDEIRDLREKAQYLPASASYKVYIIDEAHMLTKEASNALLKTLEEPPAHVIFLLATTEPAKLPATILSRCQHFHVRPISKQTIVRRMADICAAEGVVIEAEGLEEIAARAGHSMRDALSLLDQCVDLRLPGERISAADVCAFLGVSKKSRIAALADAQLRHDSAGVLDVLGALRADGCEDARLLEDLCDFYQQVLFYKLSGSARAGWLAFVKDLETHGSTEQLYFIIDTLIEAHAKLRYSALSEIITDTALVKACLEQAPEAMSAEREDRAPRPRTTAPAQQTGAQDTSSEIPQTVPLTERQEESGAQTAQHDASLKTSNPSKAHAPVQYTEKRVPLIEDTTAFREQLIQSVTGSGGIMLQHALSRAQIRQTSRTVWIVVHNDDAYIRFNTNACQTLSRLIKGKLAKPVKTEIVTADEYDRRFSGARPAVLREAEAAPEMEAAPEAEDALEDIEARVKEIIEKPDIVYERV